MTETYPLINHGCLASRNYGQIYGDNALRVDSDIPLVILSIMGMENDTKQSTTIHRVEDPPTEHFLS